PVFSPAAPAPIASDSIMRSAPNAVGGWTSEGGVPVVVAQGETAEAIATRYGVPTATLLSLNGYASRSQVTPGTRLTIPVYHANGAVRAAAAVPAAVAPRAAQVAKLEAPKAQTPALKADPVAAQAEKRAKAAQAKADEAARKVQEAQAAQAAREKAKSLKAEADKA